MAKKTLIIARHGHKNGENIAADQIRTIIANGIPAIDNNLPENTQITVHPGSSLVRTSQTIEAWEKYFLATERKPEIFFIAEDMIFEPDPRFGSEVMFARFGPLKESFKETGSWLETLKKEAPEFLEELREDMVAALDEILDWLDDSEAMVMAGHTPMIEILAQAIDPEADVSPLAELEGFVFEQEGEGPITVRRAQ
jgi:phosphohistidine phosphatase SixA